MSNIKSKIEYERSKLEQLVKKIDKKGIRFDTQFISLDANLQVIKDILFKEKKITEDEFELRYLKNVQVVFKKILEKIKTMKPSRIIIPKARIPKDLKRFKA